MTTMRENDMDDYDDDLDTYDSIYGNKTPVARVFKDDQFVVFGSRENDDEAILWLSFDFYAGTVRLSVYDQALMSYSHTFLGDTEEVTAFIAEVEKAYQTTIPANFAQSTQNYLSVLDGQFGVNVDLDSSLSYGDLYCDTCGDARGSDVDAFYFPAFTLDGETHEASIDISWSYGCYSSDEVVGLFEENEVKEKAIKLLDRMLSVDEDQSGPNHPELADFVSKIKAL